MASNKEVLSPSPNSGHIGHPYICSERKRPGKSGQFGNFLKLLSCLLLELHELPCSMEYSASPHNILCFNELPSKMQRFNLRGHCYMTVWTEPSASLKLDKFPPPGHFLLPTWSPPTTFPKCPPCFQDARPYLCQLLDQEIPWVHPAHCGTLRDISAPHTCLMLIPLN